ncbi:MAG: 1-deoxy-D-xylulose-5-phosphate reductoisomerase, partial [Ilumatobacteraceae bacterium]
LAAANEVAVEAFLAGRIAWSAIPEVATSVLDERGAHPPTSVEDVIEADRSARESASAWLASRGV